MDLYSDNEEDTVTIDPFMVKLTKAVEEDSMRMLTSTLTFTFVDGLNGVTVECTTSMNGSVAIRWALVEKTGN